MRRGIGLDLEREKEEIIGVWVYIDRRRRAGAVGAAVGVKRVNEVDKFFL